MLVFGCVEQLANDAVVKVDDFINDRGHALSRSMCTCMWRELSFLGDTGATKPACWF
jgi:hypothetical protein